MTFRKISLPSYVVDQVEEIVSANKNEYKSIAKFVTEATKNRIRRLSKQTHRETND